MTLGPILPGRLPGSLASRRLQSQLQTAGSLLANLQQQIATGQKFFAPSESPAAALRSIVLQRTLERTDAYNAVLQTDYSFLSASEQSLSGISDLLNRARSALTAGVGATTTPAEKQALADEVAGMIQEALTIGNSQFRGRYLFGGSQGLTAPFENLGSGGIAYKGDARAIDTHLDGHRLLANNVDGLAAFGASTTPVSSDVNPALSLSTRVEDLFRGAGTSLGPIVVTVDDGVNPAVTQTIDLSGAETIGDLKTRIEAAFGSGPPSITVDVDPTTKSALRLTPSAGVSPTVAVADTSGSWVARDLGLVGGPSSTLVGADLDPAVTLHTALADLNGGTGIGSTTGTGLRIVSGTAVRTVDLSAATTVEDLFNAIAAQNLDIGTTISADGSGLEVVGLRSGVPFSIGENGGTNATLLGIRTFTGATRLADLNLGVGVPVNEVDENGAPLPAPISIVRRDGSTTTVDLQGTQTVQDVLDALNAVDADLSATLNSVGNGISLTDASGTGPLTVEAGLVADALGLAGSETGSVNTVPLVGQEVNPQEARGVFGILIALERALRSGDDRELSRLDSLLNDEIDRFGTVRGELGSRMKLVDQVQNRLADGQVLQQESLSKLFDIDMTEAVTRFTSIQSALQATLQVGSSTLRLSLFDFL